MSDPAKDQTTSRAPVLGGSSMIAMAESSYNDESINRDLRVHVLKVNDWEPAALLQEYHRWVEIFNEEFALELETPAIRIDRMGVRKLGQYRCGRNGLGIKHELTVNSRHLDRSLARQLEVLLPELLHLWQAIHGQPSRSNSGYHNRQFRDKARSYGLLVDHYGHSLGVVPGPFTELLARFAVDIADLPRPQASRLTPVPTGQSKLQKFSCGCTNVRCATVLRARCLKCGRVFEPAAPAW